MLAKKKEIKMMSISKFISLSVCAISFTFCLKWFLIEFSKEDSSKCWCIFYAVGMVAEFICFIMAMFEFWDKILV